MNRGSLLALALSLSAASAHAQDSEPPVEALASAGISFRHTSDFDLADQADATGYGSGNDASPGALGFDLRAGVLFSFPLELDLTATIAVGGLAQSHLERRYFGSTDTIGGDGTAAISGSPRYAPILVPDLRALLGPSVTYERMFAASPVGAANIDFVGVGLDAGLRYRLNKIGSVANGNLELVFSVRREFPVALRVSRSQNDVLFSGVGSGDPIYSFGTSVSYVFGFHRVIRE